MFCAKSMFRHILGLRQKKYLKNFCFFKKYIKFVPKKPHDKRESISTMKYLMLQPLFYRCNEFDLGRMLNSFR